MPIYSPTGFLDVTNATLRGSKIVTTSNVGVANLNPLNTLSVGSNLQVEDTGSNVLVIHGNAAMAAVTLGAVHVAPVYDLEVVTNLGNTTSNTVQFTNDTTGFVSVSNIEIGTGNLVVDTSTGTVTVGNKLDVTDAHASNLTVASALYANAETGRVGVHTTNPGNFALDVHGSANVGALTANSLIVTGDLAVAGEVTSIRSTTVTVDDPIIGLANNNTGGVLDTGFVIQRDDANVAIIFDESTDTLEIGYTQGKHTDTTITMDDSSLFHTNIHGNVSVSNLEIGQFSVVAAYGLDHVTNENNSTGDTIISTNGTTGLQTTANVVVGRDALVSGNAVVSQDLTVAGDAMVSSNLEVGTANLFVDTVTGYVGVGTTSPGASLEVSGNVAVSSNLEVGTANLFVDTTTGNVGIGITDPGHNLDIVSEMNLRAVSNTASIKYNSNVVTEYVRSKKLVKYPRVNMTAATTSGYTASASTTYSGYNPYQAFDHSGVNSSSYWSGSSVVYDTSTGVWTGGTSSTYTTTIVDVGDVYGEWLQIELEEKISYAYSHIYAPSTHVLRSPRTGFVVGGNSSTGPWYPLHRFVDKFREESNETIAYVPDAPSDTPYRYIRIVIEALYSSTGGYAGIDQWDIYGVPEYDPGAHGTDVIVRSVPNVPNTEWLEVYYEGKNYSGSGNISDETGNGVTGVLNGSVSYDSTWKAFSFSASTNDYITGTTSISGELRHTVSLWVNFAELTSDQHYICVLGDGNTKDAHMGMYYSDNLGVRVTSGFDYRTNYHPTAGEWVHLTYAYHGATLNQGATDKRVKFYVNGSRWGFQDKYTPGNNAALNLPSSSVVRINGKSGTNNIYVDMKVANYRLFNRPLSADEIWQLYAYDKEYFKISPDVVTFTRGRIGIGTMQPMTMLDVRGDIRGGCPVFFDVSRSNSLGNLSGGQTVIFDVVRANKGGGYHRNTGVFIAPIAGYYRFFAYGLSTEGGVLSIEFRRNGDSANDRLMRTYGEASTTEWDSASMSMIYYMDVGDTMRLYNNSNFYTAASGVFYNAFQGFFLSI